MIDLEQLLGKEITIYRDRKGRKIKPRIYTGILFRKKPLFRRDYQYYISDSKKDRKIRRHDRTYFDDGTFYEF